MAAVAGLWGGADVAGKVDLYDNAYARAEDALYRQVRTETYGRDLGQTSWVSAEEADGIPGLLGLGRESHVLEVGCGAGGYAMHVAERVGCRITGLDLNPHGIAAAVRSAEAAGLGERVGFEQCDVSGRLGFEAETFDAVFANDVLCHVPGRLGLLEEVSRVLRTGGRLLFSDALVIGGMVSHEEIATRSSVGPYFFSPPGENERLLGRAGFVLLSVTDTSEQAAGVARRWREARERRREGVVGLEGRDRFEGLQRFLACVQMLTAERRLLRYLYLAEKRR